MIQKFATTAAGVVAAAFGAHLWQLLLHVPLCVTIDLHAGCREAVMNVSKGRD